MKDHFIATKYPLNLGTVYSTQFNKGIHNSLVFKGENFVMDKAKQAFATSKLPMSLHTTNRVRFAVLIIIVRLYSILSKSAES